MVLTFQVVNDGHLLSSDRADAIEEDLNSEEVVAEKKTNSSFFNSELNKALGKFTKLYPSAQKNVRDDCENQEALLNFIKDAASSLEKLLLPLVPFRNKARFFFSSKKN